MTSPLNTITNFFKPASSLSSEAPLRIVCAAPPHVADAPPTASAPRSLNTARRLVKAFLAAGRADGYVDFERARRALPFHQIKFFRDVFTPDVMKEIWDLFGSALRRSIGERAWRTCSSLRQFQDICKRLQCKPFGELGEHIAHVLLRVCFEDVPDGEKSSHVKGFKLLGFDIDFQVDAGSLLEDDMEFDGQIEVKSARVTDDSTGNPGKAFRSASDFSHKYDGYICKDVKSGRSKFTCESAYHVLAVSQKIDRGLLQRTASSILVNLIVYPDGGGSAGLTLRLSDKMSTVQRKAKQLNKRFVLEPEDTHKSERTVVGRSCGALGLQEKLDQHSAVLIRII